MSSNVNLQADEYNQLQLGLKKVHEQINRDMEDFLTKLEATLVEKEGFSDAMLKPKIEELIKTIRTDILANNSIIYQDSEECINTFIETIKSLDMVSCY